VASRVASTTGLSVQAIVPVREWSIPYAQHNDPVSLVWMTRK
jgi:hypothetical protein